MVVFIYVILIYSKNHEECERHLRIVLKNLRERQLYGKWSKYEYLLMSFCVTNSPVIFMHLINCIFHEFLDKFVVVFIDDILIYSKNQEECETHLRIVLKILRERQLYGKWSKCEFCLEHTQLVT